MTLPPLPRPRTCPRTCPRTRPRTLPLVALAVAAVLAAAVAPAAAQVENLDRAKLIDTLQREGMSELLLHLVTTEPSKDPVDNLLVQIAQLTLRFRDPQEQFSPEQEEEAFNELRAAYLNLIEGHHDHPQRPIWQTDFAEVLLFSYLQALRVNASEFYDLGSPSALQRRSFEAEAPLAFEQLVDATQGIADIINRLPRENEELHRRFVNNGTWDRLLKDYGEFRTPLFLTQAAYYATLLPDAHSYYQQLGQNKRVPRQDKSPAGERKRLLALSLEQVGPLVADAADPRRVRAMMLTFQARAQAASGQLKPAEAAVDDVIALNRGDLWDLVAKLTRGRILALSNQPLAAQDQAAGCEQHPLAQQSPMIRLLCVDLAHQVLKVTSPKDAYRPYLDLLADEDLPDDQRQWLRRYIYERWAANTPENANLSDLPDIVLVALGELAREEGQLLFQQAMAAQQEGSENRAAALSEQKMVKLKRAIQVLTTLRNRQNLDPSIDAKAVSNLAYARYFTDPMDPAVLMDSARLWIELAEKAGETPEAAEAAGYAEQVLRPWYEAQGRPDGVRELYEKAGKLLIEKYGNTAAANDARLYYAYAVPFLQGRFLEAADLFASIPAGHATFYPSREFLVQALYEAYQAAADADKPALANRLEETARTAAEELQRGIDNAQDVGDRDALLKALGGVRLVQFDLLVRGKRADDALQLVADFEGRFGHDPELVRGVLERRIVLLAELNRLDQLTGQARELMLKFPEQAGPVIDGVLRRTEQQMEELRAAAVATKIDADRAQFNARRSVLAAAAVPLAQMLLEWAKNQGLAENELVPYELTYANALRISGDAKAAVGVIEPILAKPEFADTLDVLHAAGEAYFAAGLSNGSVQDEASLIKSASFFDKIILGIPDRPFPPQWWNAWTRRLQVSEGMNQGVGNITPRVRELSRMDPGLGGEPYRSELQRLELKYAGQAQ